MLLKAEGIIDGSKQSKKEMCWSYYKSQMLYIEAMQDAKEDVEFDPRRSEHVTGKDGRFVFKKNPSSKPARWQLFPLVHKFSEGITI